MQTTALFGEKMFIQMPSSMKDMSDLVPIPDNQEVFQDIGTPCLGQLIIEITEPFETDYNPAEYAFVDLAEENEVKKFKIEKLFLVNCECSEENYAVKGTHFVEKD